MTAPPGRLRRAGTVRAAALGLPLGRAAGVVINAGLLACLCLTATTAPPRHIIPLAAGEIVAWAACLAGADYARGRCRDRGAADGPAPWQVVVLAGSPGQVRVGRVMLLGVAVSVRAVLDPAEDERRRLTGLTAVTDPALLSRLLELPAGQPARDPAAWAETSALPPGIVARGDDGHTVRRLLVPALTLLDVTVPGRPGRELEAVQRASLFAGFTARWAALAGPAPEAAILEAMVTGVGLAGPGGQVLVPPGPLLSPVFDGWAWLLAEKTYRAWRAAGRRDA